MSKANQKIRKATLGGVNWWTYFTSIRPKGHRNEPQYIDYNDVKNKKDVADVADKLSKERKKQEKRIVGAIKIFRQQNKFLINIMKPTKKAKSDQIQYGIDLPKWWSEQHE